MRRLLLLASALLLVSACGGGSSRIGGATFTGAFETEPGVGPGEISFVLDDTGDRIVSAVVDPALDQFSCPTGVRISGGGMSSTFTPGIVIEGDSFDAFGLSGEFDSPTVVRGTYDLRDSFDCPYVLTWSASSP